MNATRTCGCGDAGREHLLSRDVDVGVRRPAPRFGTVARDVRRVEPLVDRRPRDQEQRRRLRAVAAGARQLQRDVGAIEMRREARREARAPLRGRPIACEQLVRVETSGGRHLGRHRVRARPSYAQREHRGPCWSRTQLSASIGVKPRWIGHSASTSTKAKPSILDLELEGLVDRLLRPDPLLGVEERDALDVDGAVEPRDQLGHP